MFPLAPSEAPLLVKAVNTSSSSIELQWNPISLDNYGGNLLGYRIYYRPAETKRRAKVIDHRTSTLRVELTNLFLWWWYEIRIGGYTRVGTGVTTNVTVQTAEESKSIYELDSFVRKRLQLFFFARSELTHSLEVEEWPHELII